METKELTLLPSVNEYDVSDTVLLITKEGAKRIPVDNLNKNFPVDGAGITNITISEVI